MGIIDTPEILAAIAAVPMSFRKARYKLEADGLAAATEILSA
jgi:hypothetical protein